MGEYINRWAESLVNQYLSFMRIVNIRGPRQSGKTTLIRHLCDDSFVYRNLDDPSTLAAAKADPVYFVRHDAKVMCIDEIQKAPELIAALKQEVDSRGEKGRYIITGSSDVFSQASMKESLAGRIATVNLSTLSIGEIVKSEPTFLVQCARATFFDVAPDCSKDMIIEYALRGGYPEILEFGETERKLWLQSYVSSLLEHDLVQIADIRRHDIMGNVLEILAMYSSKSLNHHEIASKVGVSRPTLQSYCSYLKQLFLFDEAPSWTTTDYKRVGKLSTWFAADSGLMAAVLHLDRLRVLSDPDALGKLAQTFVFHELRALLSVQHEWALYRYRDNQKRQIDFILEKTDQLVGLAVKSSETVRSDDFVNLRWFAANLAKKPFVGIVLYAGGRVLSFGDGLWALPISLLWQGGVTGSA